MGFNSSVDKLKALPVQFIEIGKAIILKRGNTEIKVGGEEAGRIVRTLFTATQGDGATVEDLCLLFPSHLRSEIQHLIQKLTARGLLVSTTCKSPSQCEENPLDILFWHFNEKTEDVLDRLNRQHFLIVGVNLVSRQLALSLTSLGVANFHVVDHPLLRNLQLFDVHGTLKGNEWPASLATCLDGMDRLLLGSCDPLVAVSDFGRSPELRELNKLCIKQGRHFLPVVFQNAVGYVGPLTIPGESSCYECMLARRNSHLENWSNYVAVEQVSFEGQGVSGFHPSMATIVGEIAAFEMFRAYGGVLAPRIGTLIEVNLLATRLTTHKVLKVPRCPTCSSLFTRPSTTTKRSMFNISETSDA